MCLTGIRARASHSEQSRSPVLYRDQKGFPSVSVKNDQIATLERDKPHPFRNLSKSPLKSFQIWLGKELAQIAPQGCVWPEWARARARAQSQTANGPALYGASRASASKHQFVSSPRDSLASDLYTSSSPIICICRCPTRTTRRRNRFAIGVCWIWPWIRKHSWRRLASPDPMTPFARVSRALPLFHRGPRGLHIVKTSCVGSRCESHICIYHGSGAIVVLLEYHGGTKL